MMAIREIVNSLPPAYFDTLEYLMKHLSRVIKYADVNKMAESNLSIVFGPTLLRPLVDSMDTVINMQFQSTVVESMIITADWMFEK